MEPVSTILGLLAALGLVALLARQTREALRKRRAAPDLLYGPAKALLSDARYEPTGAAGYPQLVGFYKGLPVRLHAVIDTLAVRKLPAFWLLVTIPEPLPIRSTFDLMMRPAGPSSFSNFDHLPVTIARPPDFPEHAILRTNDDAHLIPNHVLAPHLDIFEDARAKELLLTPKGARVVWQIGEANRVRYGVFRQAVFAENELDPEIIRDLLDRLIAIRRSILAWNGT